MSDVGQGSPEERAREAILEGITATANEVPQIMGTQAKAETLALLARAYSMTTEYVGSGGWDMGGDD